MASTSGGGTGVVRVSASAMSSMMGWDTTVGLSVEKLLEKAHATGELSIPCRNLKTFPKHRSKNDLKDTVAVGKTPQCFQKSSYICNWNICLLGLTAPWLVSAVMAITKIYRP
jgi:hypothetical protein